VLKWREQGVGVAVPRVDFAEDASDIPDIRCRRVEGHFHLQRLFGAGAGVGMSAER